MNISLYDLSQEFQKFTAIYEQAETPEEIDEAIGTLQSLDMAIGKKLAGCCGYMKMLDGFEDLLDKEIERMKKKRESHIKKQEAFKKYLESILIPGEKWTDGNHSISWRSSESVEILDESAIPEQYMKQTISIKPDKVDIKIHLKLGAIIPGAELRKNDNLTIK